MECVKTGNQPRVTETGGSFANSENVASEDCPVLVSHSHIPAIKGPNRNGHSNKYFRLVVSCWQTTLVSRLPLRVIFQLSASCRPPLTKSGESHSDMSKLVVAQGCTWTKPKMKSTSAVRVVVLVPTRVGSRLLACPVDCAFTQTSVPNNRFIYFVHDTEAFVHWHHDSSRIVWDELVSILFHRASRYPAARLISLLLLHLDQQQVIVRGKYCSSGPSKASTGISTRSVRHAMIDQAQPVVPGNDGLLWKRYSSLPACPQAQHLRRTFLLRSVDPFRSNTLARRSRRIVITVFPPSLTQLEKSWECRLISWEHTLVQAYSLSAYLATLGGGHFLCRQLATALRLAQFQQYVATRILGGFSESSTLYKCLLNQAYNYMYAGRFRTANKILRYVEDRCFQSGDAHDYHDVTFLRMHQNARITCERMQKLHILPVELQSAHEGKQSASCSDTRKAGTACKTQVRELLTHDNWYRYRIVQDQSFSLRR
jgi:hypothetical protein